MPKSKQEFLLKPEKKKQGPVTCLGMTFENDEKRREHFIERLREKLKDPEFRKIEGFPIGEDEDILAISDPPYYTACPNPWLNDFIEQEGKPYDPDNDDYHKEPYATDTKFGKTSNTITRAHPYHTKVPPDAVADFVNHYVGTDGIVLDCFCGIGMAGVGTNIHNYENNSNVKTILCDLSTISTFVSHNYNTKADVYELEILLDEICNKLTNFTRDLYLTNHNGWLSSPRQKDIFTKKNRKANGKGIIDYIMMSEVLSCPNCGHEYLLWDKNRINTNEGVILDHFKCDSCDASISKKTSDKVWELKPDTCLKGRTQKVFKQKPVLIYYKYGGNIYCKNPDPEDIKKINSCWHNNFLNIPISKIPPGDKTNELLNGNNLYLHHCYHPFTLFALDRLLSIIDSYNNNQLITKIKYAVSPIFTSTSRMAVIHISNFFKGGGGHFISNISGFLHFPSVSFVRNVVSTFQLRINSVIKSEQLKMGKWNNSIVTCQSATDLNQINDNSIDYVFIDPPFGQNLMYSELNFIWENFLNVKTNNKKEAIINYTQGKRLGEYQSLMTQSLQEIYRVLKPRRWLTIEFHNSRNSVWRAIQEAVERAKFIVADVRILDKKLGSYNQNVSSGSTKSDLIISAYKPDKKLEEISGLKHHSAEIAWMFIDSHLNQLPIVVTNNSSIEIVFERVDYLLFDRMVAFHVQRGISVPMNASEFYAGLRERYPERDGMFFLPEQVAEYDKARMKVSEVGQLVLFVVDEKSAIQWLRNRLEKNPATYQDLHPEFLQELHQVKHEKMPELMTILEQNFLKDDQDRWYVPDIARAEDLEKIRERYLLREFWTYLPTDYKPQPESIQLSLLGNGERPTAGLSGKKIKIVRTEAVRIGFKTCWAERDYMTIIVVAERLPKNIIQEDPDLLMYYDNALMRVGD